MGSNREKSNIAIAISIILGAPITVCLVWEYVLIGSTS